MKKIQKILTGLCVISTLLSVVSCGKDSAKEPETPVVNYEVECSEETLLMISGDNKTLTASAYMDDQADENAVFSWKSSDTDVVTVVGGVVTALASGRAYITVKYENVVDVVAVNVLGKVSKEEVNSFDEEYIRIFGRSYLKDGALALEHTANGVEVGIVGDGLQANIKTSATSYMRVWVDGVEQAERVQITPQKTTYTVAENLEEGYHVIKMIKATEMQLSSWELVSLDADQFVEPAQFDGLKIEFIGDSITAGYGVLGVSGEGRTTENSDPTRSYAFQTANLLNAEHSVVAWSGICTKAFHWAKNVNMEYLYEMTGFTNRAGYSFDFKPDIVVVNLGMNDADYMSWVDPSYALQFASDYLEFLKLVREKNPNAFIICLYGMMGKNTTVDTGIQAAVESLADEKIVYNPITIVENFDGAGAHPSLVAQTNWAQMLAEYIRALDL